ncbi:MAG: lipid II:glycine glycyltransferase FemX, partial [Candidatus Hermodarchaeia archaeon]
YVPNELLIWHILKGGTENGLKTYDFGGAGKPDEEYGVRDFKSKFGGDLVRYGRNRYARSKARLVVSKFGYEFYRRYLGFRR